MKFTVNQIKRIIRQELIREAVPSYSPKSYSSGINKKGDNAISSFQTSAVDNTADSLWDNYWIPAKPVVKIARGLGIIDHLDLSDKKQIRETAQALQHIQKEGFKRIKESSLDWEKNFKWAKKDELKVIQFLIGMSHSGISDVIKDMKKNPSAFKSFVKDLAKQGLYEGFAGAMKEGDRKEFEKIRKQQAEVLGYTLTGKSDVKSDIGDATVTEGKLQEQGDLMWALDWESEIAQLINSKELKMSLKSPNRKIKTIAQRLRKNLISVHIGFDGLKDEVRRVYGEGKLSEGVADEIRKQIPRRTLSYVGAKNFAKGKSPKGEFLEFSVKGSRLKTGGKIKVIYSKGGDDYTIEAWQIRGTNVKLVKKHERIQVDKLGRTIENLVG